MPMKNPPHPGDFIRTELIIPAGLSVNRGGEGTPGFPADIVQPAQWAGADLSGDMALRIEKAFGVEDGHAHADAGVL